VYLGPSNIRWVAEIVYDAICQFETQINEVHAGYPRKIRIYEDCVTFIVNRAHQGIYTSPKDLHNEWCRLKKDDGWRYSSGKSFPEKEDPYLVEWDDLTDKKKLKATLFLNIVRTFLPGNG